jgi:hypothetical protein
MQSLRRRVERLERGPAHSNEGGLQVVVMRAGMEFALDSNRCVEILRQSGFLQTGPHFPLIRLGDVPPNLNAEELEEYLREHGGEICNASAGQRPPLAPKADR